MLTNCNIHGQTDTLYLYHRIIHGHTSFMFFTALTAHATSFPRERSIFHAKLRVYTQTVLIQDRMDIKLRTTEVTLPQSLPDR